MIPNRFYYKYFLSFSGQKLLQKFTSYSNRNDDSSNSSSSLKVTNPDITASLNQVSVIIINELSSIHYLLIFFFSDITTIRHCT